MTAPRFLPINLLCQAAVCVCWEFQVWWEEEEEEEEEEKAAKPSDNNKSKRRRGALQRRLLKKIWKNDDVSRLTFLFVWEATTPYVVPSRCCCCSRIIFARKIMKKSNGDFVSACGLYNWDPILLPWGGNRIRFSEKNIPPRHRS